MFALAACVVATTFGATEPTPSNFESGAASRILFEERVETGVLFLNGVYLRAPYELTATEAAFHVNDVTIPWSMFAQQPFSAPAEKVVHAQRDKERGPQPRRRGRWVAGFMRALERSDQAEESRVHDREQEYFATSTAHSEPALAAGNRVSPSTGIDVGIDYPLEPNAFAQLVVRVLRAGDPVVHLPGEPVLVAQESMTIDSVYASLASSPVAGEFDVLEWDDCLPMRSDATTWTEWLGAFATPPDLENYIVERFRAIDEFVAEARSTRAALMTIDDAAYPLSVLGMLIAVMSLGHLLRSVPDSSECSQTTSSERLRKATTIAVCLIAGLSILDLTWTILAAQAGTMRELNPLGAQLIHDPAALAAFKLVATAVGCGLLYNLRSHRRAADASWWMCLVMTVVTFRWVMFNSMFA